MKVYMVIEDDSDIRGLIRMMFAKDPDFTVAGETESAEEGLEMLGSAGSDGAGLIVLDHGLTGELTGIEAAPMIRKVAPAVKIILFTADPTLEVRAKNEPAIDAFLVKTNIRQLVPTARRVCGLMAS